MDAIEKKKVSFDVESGNFIVQGHLRNYLVQLFPIRDCSCAAGKTGRCHHVFACETLIGIRNEKSKKPNSTAFRKRSRSLPDKRSGNKNPRRLDLDPGRYPTKESEEEELRLIENCLSPSQATDDESSNDGERRKDESRMKKIAMKIEKYIPCELDEQVERYFKVIKLINYFCLQSKHKYSLEIAKSS